MPRSVIHQSLQDHVEAAAKFFDAYGEALVHLSDKMVHALKHGNKLLFCGNGGSACDAMHIAGEFVGRFMQERAGIPAIALTADSGIITAVANDYGFEHVFARQVEALGGKGDILVALSTSGSSANVLSALESARERKLFTVLMTGEKGRAQTTVADLLLAVPSFDTARVQEVHMLALHMLAAIVEKEIIS